MKKSEKSFAIPFSGSSISPQPKPAARMKTATLHFHSLAAKSAFNKRNKVAAGEIIAQGPGWQTMVDDGTNFAASPFVYSVA